MEQNKPQEICASYYIAHQQAITETQKRIEKLENNVDGMPQEIQFIKENVNRMCLSMDKLLVRLEEKYVPRELFDNKLIGVKDQLIDLRDDTDNKLEETETQLNKIEDQNKWLMRGMLAFLLYLLKDIILGTLNK